MSALTSKEAFAKLPQKLHNFFIKHPPRPFAQYKDGPSTTTDPIKNPFYPNKHLETGRWHSPHYSRRRSADLFKMAKKFGIQDLLPPTPRKFHDEKYNNNKWMMGMVQPAGRANQAELDEKFRKRAEAIKNMDQIITEVRPSYKKLLRKRKEKEPKWY
ncbi:mitochondrial 54S ribosomal protein mL59 [Lodderomyces beijingensis]|uniref:Large ribosomal subunit protein mL59 domain-containing protein n=1 Tax=Lodderomyces beijingensis TaxID=1775926 RepID=A0ABP0ZLM4_9ASCO